MKVKTLPRQFLTVLLGHVIPFASAFFSVPFIIRFFGVEQFGLITMCWLSIGYMSFLDLGTGLAMTRELSQARHQKNSVETSQTLFSGLVVLFCLGFLGSLVVFAGASTLAEIISSKASLSATELGVYLKIMAISLPFVILTSGLRGALEARMAYKTTSLLQSFLGLGTYVLPLFSIHMDSPLIYFFEFLVIGRILICLIFLFLVLKKYSVFSHDISLQTHLLKSFLKYGGWVSVSSAIAPLYSLGERFLTSRLVSLTAVGFYSTPFDMLSRIFVIPSAAISILFPRFSKHQNPLDNKTASEHDYSSLFFKSQILLGLLLIIPLTALSLFSNEILELWINPAIAETSGPLLKFLTLGFFIHSVSYIPDSFLRAVGKPHISGLLLMGFLPFYFLSNYLLLPLIGIWALAYTYTAWISLQFFCLNFFCLKSINRSSTFWKIFLIFTAGIIPLWTLTISLQGLMIKFVFWCSLTTVVGIYSWKRRL